MQIKDITDYRPVGSGHRMIVCDLQHNYYFDTDNKEAADLWVDRITAAVRYALANDLSETTRRSSFAPISAIPTEPEELAG